MPGEALFYLMVQNVMVNTVLTFGKSVLEHCDGRIVGDWYLDCEHVLAFSKVHMADAKRTYWWLSRFCNRPSFEQK